MKHYKEEFYSIEAEIPRFLEEPGTERRLSIADERLKNDLARKLSELIVEDFLVKTELPRDLYRYSIQVHVRTEIKGKS